MAKRKVATLGIGFGTNNLKDLYKNKLRIKQGLLAELDNINNQLLNHEKDLSGFNGQNSVNAVRDDFKKAPARSYDTTDSGL